MFWLHLLYTQNIIFWFFSLILVYWSAYFMNMLDGYVYGATFANYQLRLFMLPQARDESSYSEKNLFFMYFLKILLRLFIGSVSTSRKAMTLLTDFLICELLIWSFLNDTCKKQPMLLVQRHFCFSLIRKIKQVFLNLYF